MDPTPSGRSPSVSDDWRRWLTGSKNEAFRACRADLESSYGMLSVSLDEAIEFVRRGSLHKARQAACVAPELCERLVISLAALLHQMSEHARFYGTIPNAVPLDAANFRGHREQRLARINSLFSRILLTQRSQFLYKLSTLEEMIHSLQMDFNSHAEQLIAGEPEDPFALCTALDANHFDLTTCLQETIVLLKSFFVVLPEKHAPLFERSVRAIREAGAAPRGRLHAIHARRAVQLAGQ